MEPDHPVGSLYGSVLDERNDSIDFATNEPVHTHGGSPIDLSTGCPAIYKYAYLTGVQPPTFGHQTTTNPLAWHIDPGIADLDRTASKYRVRAENGAVILDWTSMAADSKGIYTIELHRDGQAGIAALGAQVGKYYLDTHFQTTSGVETVKSACWQNHPLAAPIAFAATQKDALFAMSFAAHSTISDVLNLQTNGVPVMNVPLSQQTTEPITLEIKLPALPSGTGTRETTDRWWAYNTYDANIACGSTPCAGSPAPNPVTTSGPISGQWQLRVTDDVSGATICNTNLGTTLGAECVIPARVAAEGPHGYHLVLALSSETSIAPPITDPLTASSYYSILLNNEWLVGTSLSDRANGCYTQKRNVATGTYTCNKMAAYQRASVLNQARLAFDPIRLDFAARVGDATTELPLTYVPTNATSFAAAWDAGNDGL